MQPWLAKCKSAKTKERTLFNKAEEEVGSAITKCSCCALQLMYGHESSPSGLLYFK